MGACGSHEDPASAGDEEQKKQSRQIEQMLREEQKQVSQVVKMLLLGTGESGKSTIFKQMKLLSNEEFSDEEKDDFRRAVRATLVTQIQLLVDAAEENGLEFTDDAVSKMTDTLLEVDPQEKDFWRSEYRAMIKTLWQHTNIQKAYTEGWVKSKLNDCAAYFLDDVDRVADDDYVPIEQDVIRVRVRTSGIKEADFVFGGLKFKLIDVGGQRTERKKWMHCFDNVTAIIYCISLSEYDLVLREDNHTNRMKESLRLFESITNSPWFKSTPFVLFFNKRDLFEEKIKRVDLNVCFPKYDGGLDAEKAEAYIAQQFKDINDSPHPIYPHFTIAIDTENIRFVFRAVQETLLDKLMRQMF